MAVRVRFPFRAQNTAGNILIISRFCFLGYKQGINKRHNPYLFCAFASVSLIIKEKAAQVYRHTRSESTNYYDMVKFLSPNGEIKVGLQQVIEHIMDIVDEHLNQGIKVKDDHVMIFNLEQFVKKTTELDYAMTVEMLVRRLVGIKGEPNYRKIIRQIIENETDVNPEANLEIIESRRTIRI